MATAPQNPFNGNAFTGSPQATSQMPMGQIDAARAAGGYGGSIPTSLPAMAPAAPVAAPAMPQLPAQANPRAVQAVAGQRPTLPAQANQRAVAAVNRQAQPRMMASQPVAQPPVNPQMTSQQAAMAQPQGQRPGLPVMGQGLIGRPMMGEAMPMPMQAQPQYPTV